MYDFRYQLRSRSIGMVRKINVRDGISHSALNKESEQETGAIKHDEYSEDHEQKKG